MTAGGECGGGEGGLARGEGGGGLGGAVEGEGDGAGGVAARDVAVRVTLWLAVDGLSEEARAVVVAPSGLTVSETVAGALAATPLLTVNVKPSEPV